MERMILASKSPRRQEIMSLGGYEYEVKVSDAEERISQSEYENLPPDKMVEYLARIKAEDVYRNEKSPENLVVIGADTVVSVDGYVLGKPKDKEDAVHMLTLLSGRSHDVYTGICILWSDTEHPHIVKGYGSSCHTEVVFYPMRDAEIREYVATNDGMDKAGAYGIQSGAAKFIREIHGDYLNVVGLPLSKIYHILDKKLSNFTIKL